MFGDFGAFRVMPCMCVPAQGTFRFSEIEKRLSVFSFLFCFTNGGDERVTGELKTTLSQAGLVSCGEAELMSGRASA